MAQHKSTLNKALPISTKAVALLWSSFDSGANDVYFDVNGVNADKMIILGMGHSTLINTWWIGTSDSRSSGAGGLGTKAYPYSAARVGRIKVRTTVAADGHARSKFKSTRSTAGAIDTQVFAIFAIGPVETARFKDSNGRIHVCRGVTSVGGVSQSSDEQHICAILLP